MSSNLPAPLWLGLAAFASSAGLTALMRPLARRLDWIAPPSRDRWHRRAVPLGGGIAVGLAFFGTAIASGRVKGVDSFLVLAALALLGGFLDDRFHLFPPTKLVTQIVLAALLVVLGFTLPVDAGTTPRLLLSILWVVGLTNAINLLDNMDGLAAGVAVIAGVYLAILSSLAHAPAHAELAALLAGAAGGFLVHNFHPAAIFMGNTGSYPLGFLLAGLCLTFPQSDAAHGSRLALGSQIAVLAPPVLILLLPIFDTTLVTFVRKLQGRAISEGGRDHSSHRLVALGLSERQAVWVLYGMAGFSGAAALAVRLLGTRLAFVLVPLVLTLFALLGVWLAGVRVGAEGEAAPRGPFVALLADFTYKRRIFEVLLDFVLVTVAYQASYLLRFEGAELDHSFALFFQSLPVVIACQVLGFLLAGLYRGVWRYMSLADLPVLLRSVLLASALTVLAILFLWRFQGFSRTLFLIDGILLALLVGGARISFRLFDRFLGPGSPRGRRTLIYGAGDRGVVALQEILSNHAWGLAPVGFVDDDPHLVGRRIHGLPVLPNGRGLGDVLQRHRVEEVVLTIPRAPADRVESLRRLCTERGIALRRLVVELPCESPASSPRSPGRETR